MNGNKKHLLDEWEKVHRLQDESTANIDPFIREQDGISGANPDYVKKRDRIWSKGAEELLPLADELDKQETFAKQKQMARFAALKKLLKGE